MYVLTTEEKLAKARIQLQKKSPFFAYLLLHSEMEEDTKMGIPTMGVNAKGKMFYNKEFVDKLSDPELEAVLCHEVLHVALEHLYRSGKMEHRQDIGNIAADLVVNDILVESNFQLPKTPLIPRNHKISTPQFTVEKIDEKGMEEIYDEIYGQIPKQPPCQTCNGTGQDGNGNPCPDCQNNGSGNGPETLDRHMISDKGKDSQERRNNQKKWKKLIINAGQYAKMRGELPAGIERRLGEMFESKLNWKQLLNHYITKQIPYDYTYSRPSNKSLPVGCYLPSIRKDQKLEIIVAIDTSGSIGQDELSMFLGEMIGIARTYPTVDMRIIDCDCDIQSDIQVRNGNISKIKAITPMGGGGTSHVPVYEHVQENYPNTKILINFTDGYTAFPERTKYRWDSIWVLTKHSCSEEDIPFGKVVKVE